MTTLEPVAPSSPASRPHSSRADLLVVAGGVALVAAASVVGWELVARGVPVLVEFPPLLASWDPHVGPGTVPAVLVAVAVVAWGPGYAATRPWRRVLGAAWLAALVWTTSLALVDGFERGFAARLTTLTEYLHEVPRIVSTGVPQFLETFASLVPNDRPGFWTTHVAGHPPLATLVFVWLDQLSLGGGVVASSVVVVIGSSAVVAVAVALRALGAETEARAFVPFGVLFAGAVFVGVSADGMFAAILAWGVALTALACARDRAGDPFGGAALALGAGVVLGACLFLNYGLSVGMLLPLAVVALTRAWRPVLPVVAGAGAVTAAFALAGFWWFDGYHALVLRYAQPGEYGGLRPYSYWVWANLAALVVVIGPATLVGLRRIVAARRTAIGPLSTAPRGWVVVAALTAAALVAVALADLSGLSKAEVERIWLPFAVWLSVATAFVPRVRVRGWLAAQALLALAVNHLFLTTW